MRSEGGERRVSERDGEGISLGCGDRQAKALGPKGARLAEKLQESPSSLEASKLWGQRHE